MEKVLLTTGGTGGHIFPALAVAEELRRRHAGLELLFMGSQYGPERRLVERAGIPFVGLPVRGFLGRGLRAAGAAWHMLGACGTAFSVIRRFRPQAVAGFGGYASFAPLLAARLCGVPGILHEQNAIAGLSNKVLSLLVDRVCLSLEGTSGFAAARCIFTGNPVRAEVAAVGCRQPSFTGRRLLIMGGSQGAHAINAYMREQLSRFRDAGVQIRHQTGRADEAATRAAYVAAGYDGDCVSAFIDDMAGAYAWADLVLCRAGATTVAELCAVGLPSVLVPFPHAAHDHQTSNALALERAGAARHLPESRMASDDLAGMLLVLLADEATCRAMGRKALAAGCPHAAAAVCHVLERVAGGLPDAPRQRG